MHISFFANREDNLIKATRVRAFITTKAAVTDKGVDTRQRLGCPLVGFARETVLWYIHIRNGCGVPYNARVKIFLSSNGEHIWTLISLG
jgi:hypothetical protein